MEKRTLNDLCEEYIHQVWCIEDMKELGAAGLYALEMHRIDLHDAICDSLGIDHVKSKEILSYLDEKIGIDFSVVPTDSMLRDYAEKLINLLEKNKERLKA